MNRINLNGKVNAANEAENARPTRRTDVGREPEQQSALSLNGPAANADAVNVSARGTKAAELAGRISQLPDIRTDLVSRLSSQINAGTYRPAARDIADALIRSEQ
jgi:flagellar biosynthesis anti-sigma factor FlgM